MPGPKKMAHHSDLMNKMAGIVGADLGAAVEAGGIDVEMIRAATISCSHCEDAGGCPGWQKDHAEGAEAPPDYCRNRNLMLALKG